MDQNSAYLRSNAARYNSTKLEFMGAEATADSAIIKRKGKGKDWKRTRKAMRKKAYSSKAQMAF